MITLDVLISDHHGAGRDALQTICDYADVTGQIILLSACSTFTDLDMKGSPERDKELVEFYTSYGFTPSIRSYTYNGVPCDKNIMERHPDDHPATVRIR